MRMPRNKFAVIAVGLFLIHLLLVSNFAQEETRRAQNDSTKSNQKVRSVTIPVSIFTRRELKEKQTEEFVQAGNISVREDGDEQVILSIRSVGSDTPLAIAVLIQDDLTSNANLQLPDIRRFIRNLPQGSRVMVAYLRSGSLLIRQKFTEDLEKAASSIRIVTGSAALAPSSPYEQVDEALKRFDALPNGRRAVLLVSDGLDASRGVDNFSRPQSIDLDRAILKAQRKSVAIYSFYNAATFTENGGSSLILNAQSSLERLSNETGGRAFFQGTSSPISFVPFFRDLNTALNRQFALTYLSTHFKKGYHKIEVTSTNTDVKIQHPKGYFYR
jgi:VWFA-related protein